MARKTTPNSGSSKRKATKPQTETPELRPEEADDVEKVLEVQTDDIASSAAAEEAGETVEAKGGIASEDIDEAPEFADSDTLILIEKDNSPQTVEGVRPKGGFVLLLAGGVVAGLIGFGAGYFLQFQKDKPEDAIADLRSSIQAEFDAQNGRISDLEDKITSVDSSGSTERLESLLKDLSNTASSLSKRLDDLEQQITEMDTNAPDSGVSGDTNSALQNELRALQAALDVQRLELEAIQAASEAETANTQSVAEATLRRAAMSRIQTALDTGQSFNDATSELSLLDISVPTALEKHASSGVSSLADLQTEFPDAARAALAAARDDAAKTGGTGGFTSFLRNQLGARSLKPREGSDPDAVLSRVEAAMHEGQLSEALMEMAALPQVARSELADWEQSVKDRLEAVTAAQDLSDDLN